MACKNALFPALHPETFDPKRGGGGAIDVPPWMPGPTVNKSPFRDTL